MAAQPIAPRAGRPTPPQMRTVIGPGVRAGLQLWLQRRLNSEESAPRALMVIAALDIAYGPRTSLGRWSAIDAHIAQCHEELLDVVHATLIAIQMGDKAYTPRRTKRWTGFSPLGGPLGRRPRTDSFTAPTRRRKLSSSVRRKHLTRRATTYVRHGTRRTPAAEIRPTHGTTPSRQSRPC